ncbi:MAG: hypothetical protein B5M53_12195 [Candidatus Cloacimonas sp. 4484_209]|nr:MAG: hypothetical protein B5M53_12195 [Candidatus Cloacimonas sp. 4484_209]
MSDFHISNKLVKEGRRQSQYPKEASLSYDISSHKIREEIEKQQSEKGELGLITEPEEEYILSYQ